MSDHPQIGRIIDTFFAHVTSILTQWHSIYESDQDIQKMCSSYNSSYVFVDENNVRGQYLIILCVNNWLIYFLVQNFERICNPLQAFVDKNNILWPVPTVPNYTLCQLLFVTVTACRSTCQWPVHDSAELSFSFYPSPSWEATRLLPEKDIWIRGSTTHFTCSSQSKTKRTGALLRHL